MMNTIRVFVAKYFLSHIWALIARMAFTQQKYLHTAIRIAGATYNYAETHYNEISEHERIDYDHVTDEAGRRIMHVKIVILAPITEDTENSVIQIRVASKLKAILLADLLESMEVGAPFDLQVVIHPPSDSTKPWMRKVTTTYKVDVSS